MGFMNVRQVLYHSHFFFCIPLFYDLAVVSTFFLVFALVRSHDANTESSQVYTRSISSALLPPPQHLVPLVSFKDNDT